MLPLERIAYSPIKERSRLTLPGGASRRLGVAQPLNFRVAGGAAFAVEFSGGRPLAALKL